MVRLRYLEDVLCEERGVDFWRLGFIWRVVVIICFERVGFEGLEGFKRKRGEEGVVAFEF